MKRLYHWLIIIISVLVLAWFYGYDKLLFERPQSVHHWRQSDCASLTLNYYQSDIPLTEPQIHALISDYGTTAKNAPSEVPVYYWSIARLYDVFGPEEAILRGVNTFLFLAGIMAFVRALYIFSSHLLWSILTGLLLFTSPVLLYYGNNFLTNAPSFGMALCGLAFFAAFLKYDRKKYWRWAVVFFLLAGLLKLPGLFLFIAIGGVCLAGLLKPRLKIRGLSFSGYIAYALPVFLLLAVWVIYAHQYNQAHHTVYFSTTTFPVWDYTWQGMWEMVKQIYRNWYGHHFHPLTFAFLGILLFFILFKARRMRLNFVLLLLFLLAGLFCYFLLQFYTFRDHDYYTINMYILPALLLLMLTDYLAAWKKKLLHSPWILGLLALSLAGNVVYARTQLQQRYSGYLNDYRHEHPDLYGNTDDWLTEIGVGSDDTVIFVRDLSHTSLYLMNRYGWTDHKMAFKDTSQTIVFNRTEEDIRRSIARGAEYLIVYGIRDLYALTYLHSFERHLAGRKGEMFVFDLRDSTRNFVLPERKAEERYFYDFEEAGSLPVVSEKRTDSVVYSGHYALRAGPGDEFLTEIKLPQVQEGMLVQVRVWVNAPDAVKAIPVIQSEDPDLAFVQESNIKKHKGGWKLLEQELIISGAISKKGIKVFLWNPEKAEVYYDDLEVTVYGVNPLLAGD